MKKMIRIAGVMTALLFSAGVFAHGEHGHDTATVSMVEAKGLASQEVERLIKEGKIDKTWAGQPLSASMARVNNQRQWVVTTTADTDKGAQELQLFLSTEGYFLSYGVVEK